LCAFCNVQAQNSSYANRMQHIFGNIDQNNKPISAETVYGEILDLNGLFI
jgi:hypothetical protein